MAREWQHLKMMKCLGRGHDPAGFSQTKEGECAVLCPACPQPGKNMLPGSSTEADPSLSKGWAYIVEETKYKVHLELHEAEVEPVQM